MLLIYATYRSLFYFQEMVQLFVNMVVGGEEKNIMEKIRQKAVPVDPPPKRVATCLTSGLAHGEANTVRELIQPEKT